MVIRLPIHGAAAVFPILLAAAFVPACEAARAERGTSSAAQTTLAQDGEGTNSSKVMTRDWSTKRMAMRRLLFAGGGQADHSATAAAQCGENCVGLLDYGAISRMFPVHQWAVGAGMVLWCVVLVWLLNDTAQEYFVPPMVYWAKVLQLSPEMAGATLVALGNGAPDVFSIGAAANRDAIQLALSELFGANIFVMCITGSAVLLVWHKQCNRSTKLRTAAAAGVPLLHCGQVVLGFLAATTLYSMVIFHGRITFSQAVFFPFLYVLYLGSLAYNGSGHEGTEMQCEAGEALSGLAPPPPDAAWYSKVGWVLAWPTYLIRWLLIPPADQRWDRSRRLVSTFSPVGITLFVASFLVEGGVTGMQPMVLWGTAAIAVALGLSIFIFSDDGPRLPTFYPVLALTSKLSSILVMSMLAGEIAALVMTLGSVMGVPAVCLGSTVVAWGNSLGDFFAGIAMVSQGQARVAFTALFAGPLFNDLVGGGFALAALAHEGGGTAILWRSRSSFRAALLMTIGLLGAATVVVALALAGTSSGARVATMALLVIYTLFATLVLPMEYHTQDVG